MVMQVMPRSPLSQLLTVPKLVLTLPRDGEVGEFVRDFFDGSPYFDFHYMSTELFESPKHGYATREAKSTQQFRIMV